MPCTYYAFVCILFIVDPPEKEDDDFTSSTTAFPNATIGYYDYTVPNSFDYADMYEALDTLSPEEMDKAFRMYKSFNALFRSSADDLV